MNGVYLDLHAIVLGAVLLGVWSLVALCIGLIVGAVISQGGVPDDDSTWLDDAPDGRTDTEAIYFPREWVL